MSEHDVNIGLVLNGRYRVHERLGSGSHGHVYMGMQVGTERKVAIKLLRREALEDPELEARFQREGMVMCSLRSAHTITTYDFDQTADGIMYLVMELSDGRPLSRLIDEEAPIEWRRVLSMLGQICEALAEAHQNAIVHRDLKPANILVEARPGNRDFIKVLDFGIAKLLHGEPIGMDTVPKLTARGQTIGTLRYMSPEQLMGAPLDGRSDIYTLGVLCFELLTKSVPFPEANKPAKLIAAQLRQEPDPPSTVHPAGRIPSGVDQLLLTMLAKEPDHRFGDAQALWQTCEAILAGAGQEQAQPNDRTPSGEQAHANSAGPGAAPRAVTDPYAATSPHDIFNPPPQPDALAAWDTEVRAATDPPFASEATDQRTMVVAKASGASKAIWWIAAALLVAAGLAALALL
jgi:serine/threonine protein kinase